LIDWVYVDDVAYGLARMALAREIAGRTIDLGSGTPISTADFVERICALVRAGLRPEIGAIADRSPEPERVADVAETTRALGWAPSAALDDGLTRTIDWHRAQRSA